jgi:hypothetical protein
MLQRGSKTQGIIYEETTAGTPPAPGANGLHLPLISMGLITEQGTVQSEVLRGDRNPAAPAEDERTTSGDIVIGPDSRSEGFLLKHLMGSVNTTLDTPSAGLNTHVFTVGDLPAGLTAEKWFPDIPAAPRHTGVRINGVSMDLTPGGLLRMTFDAIGMNMVEPIPTARLDTTPLQYASSAFRLPKITLQEGGSGLVTASGFSINLTNNIEEIRVLGGGGAPAALPEGIFGADGTLSVLFDSLTLINKALNWTKSSIEIAFPSPITGHVMKLILAEVWYRFRSPGIPGPAGLIADLDFIAAIETGTSAARWEVINDVTSYAAIP